MKFADILQMLLDLPDDHIDDFVIQRKTFLQENSGFQERKEYDNVKPYSGNVVFYRYFFHENKTNIIANSSFSAYYSYLPDATDDIVKDVIRKIKATKDLSIDTILKIVSNCVYEYFGGASVEGTIEDRFSHIKDFDELADDEKNLQSSFKGTKNAWCTERATAVHQILQMLGFNCEMVISPILNDVNREYHAFNLIKLTDRTILLDTTMLDYSSQEKIDLPIVFDNLPNEAYDDICCLPEKEFMGRNGKKRLVVYNPERQHSIARGINPNAETNNEMI